MNNRATWAFGLLSFALATVLPLSAQNTNQGKAPVYTYLAEWAVPRAQTKHSRKIRRWAAHCNRW